MKAGNLIIKWRHHSSYLINEKESRLPHTVCFIINNENEESIGCALCNPKDNYCRAIGRKLSLARAMKAAKLPKEERTVIWEIYRNSAPNKRW